MNLNYKIKIIRPCADVEGFTFEGFFEECPSSGRLEQYCDKVININNNSLIICKHKFFEMYIYDGKRFVMTKLQSETIGTNFLKDVT